MACFYFCKRREVSVLLRDDINTVIKLNEIHNKILMLKFLKNEVSIIWPSEILLIKNNRYSQSIHTEETKEILELANDLIATKYESLDSIYLDRKTGKWNMQVLDFDKRLISIPI